MWEYERGCNARPTYRTTFIDPDYRHNPHGTADHEFCARCQRAIKNGSPRRRIHLVDDGPFALHRDDEEAYAAAGSPHDGGWWVVGLDCARIIGKEFTHE